MHVYEYLQDKLWDIRFKIEMMWDNFYYTYVSPGASVMYYLED
jgi:hypothetical protein